MLNFCFLPCVTGLYVIELKHPPFFAILSAQQSLYQTVHVNYSDNLIFLRKAITVGNIILCAHTRVFKFMFFTHVQGGWCWGWLSALKRNLKS